MTEKEILDLPTGVVSFYMDIIDPRTPGVVGYFSCVKIYFWYFYGRSPAMLAVGHSVLPLSFRSFFSFAA